MVYHKTKVILLTLLVVASFSIGASSALIEVAPSNNNTGASHGMASPNVSSGVSSPAVSSVKPLGPYGHYYCGLGSAIWSGQLWTPVILLNSPYRGSAESYSGETYQTHYSIGGFSSSTSSTNAWQISARNGDAKGLFQLDTWTIYNTQLKFTAAGGVSEGCTVGQTAEITSTSSHFAPIYIIHSHGTTSDIGEPTQVSYPLNGVNYTSVIFNNGFNPNTWSDTSPSMTVGGGAGATFTTSGQTMNSVGFSISAVISGSTDILSGTLTGVTSGIWDWWTFSYHYYGFTYTFPNLGVGTYELQALAGGSSEGVGYAFNYVS